MSVVLEGVVIDSPLLINPIPVIELKPPQCKLGQRSDSGWNAFRQSHHKGS